MGFDEVRDKVISNIDILIKEKQMLFVYLHYILGMIDRLHDDIEIKNYAKNEINLYLLAMIQRSGSEQDINQLILDYLDSLDFPEEFECSDVNEMIVGFIKILETSYFKRAGNYSRITGNYYNLISRHIMIPSVLEINDNTEYLDDKTYQLMINAIKNK